MNSNNYIELNRTFHKLSSYAKTVSEEEFDVDRYFSIENGVGWDTLLKQHRVIILSEAGSGKTEELIQAAIKQEKAGCPAFFLRLEDIVDDFKSAFGVGSHKKFKQWLKSGCEGWIFLDSVDEARLRDPRDFQKALKRLSSKLDDEALNRTYIIISSRPSAWRGKTDYELCQKILRYISSNTQASSSEDEETSAPDDSKNSSDLTQFTTTETDNNKADFEIYTLNDLNREKVKKFITKKGIGDAEKFLADVERQDAWDFTVRPQDLEELAEYWQDHGKIGTRLELMQNNVERRLRERDQNRAEIQTLSLEKAKSGTRLLAAASILGKEASINTPDGSKKNNGIDAKSILAGWDDKECLALLSRPMFDEANFGAVRFHHRTVKEYLAAEWIKSLLNRQGSRKRIEALFFQNRYGRELIVPSMRHVLSWVILFDEKIRQRTYEIEPEVFLEGGDPNNLSLDLRSKILRSVCKNLSSEESDRSASSYEAVQRFAKEDLANEIIALLRKYKSNSDVVSFLLRMIWQARIKKALPLANKYALDFNLDKYTQIAAIRAVQEIGDSSDYKEILNRTVKGKGPYDRRHISEIVDGLEADSASIDWLVRVLPKTKKIRNYDDAGLGDSLILFVERLPTSLLKIYLDKIGILLRRKPVIERGYCEVSKNYGWLLNSTAAAVERLIAAKHSDSFSPSCLYALYVIPAYSQYHDFEFRKLKDHSFSEVVSQWKELNYKLFWYSVDHTRKSLDKKKKERLTEYWRIESVFGWSWAFDKHDFNYVLQQITERELVDDRLIMLTLAFRLYRDEGRPRKWRDQLKRSVIGQKELESRLHEMLHPGPMSDVERTHKKQNAKWERRRKQREEKNRANRLEWKEWLHKNRKTLRSGKHINEGVCIYAYRYLIDRMREKVEGSSHWADGNWENLIDEFGEDVARSFRDGAVSFWRNCTPKLVSEVQEKNQIPLEVVVGLIGIEIEARESGNWPNNLTEDNVRIACRYAFRELNGFPNWFEGLFNCFPEIVHEEVLREIKWEIDNTKQDVALHHVINKVVWDAKWLWEDMAPDMIKILNKEPENLQNLSDFLSIIQQSETISDAKISSLASIKCNSLMKNDHLPMWLSVWMGVKPDESYDFLESHLASISNTKEATDFAMSFIVNLVGDKRGNSYSRRAFVNPENLKKIYLLMFRYIRSEEDIHREGGGVYSPNARDDAQDARGQLFSLLTSIPGKETYLSLKELARIHPDEQRKGWVLHSAKKRAEQDSELEPMSDRAFGEFNAELESTPANHVELFNLAKWRFIDLKDDLEQGDSSNASLLVKADDELEVRKYVGNWLREKAGGKYSVPQEEELADAKKPDIRFHGNGFDAPVPVELKLAENWPGAKLYERLRNQLCGDYLRDIRSGRGLFVLVYRGTGKSSWRTPTGAVIPDFNSLTVALQKYWQRISDKFPHIDEIEVIGIDLTKRSGKKKLNKKAKKKVGKKKSGN